MKETINQLKQSPLFNLSLSSKELFHSNFLAWFFEQNRPVASDFFSRKTKFPLGELKYVKRENRNMDLVLYFENNSTQQSTSIAIENKIKSIPQKPQLEGYKKNVNHLYVLSIYEPQNFEDYDFIHYKEIAKLVQRKCKPGEADYLSELYKDYSGFISSLLRLTKEWQSMEKFDFHSNYNPGNEKNNYHKLREIRIHDLYHKVKYNQFVQLLFEATKKQIPKENGKNLVPYEYFSNSTGAASLWYFLTEDKKNKYIEIQIQDYVIRLMIVWKDCESKKNEVVQNKTIQKMYNLFHEEYIQEITGEELYPLNGNFNKFGKNVIYRQKKIDETDIKKIIAASSKFFAEAIQIAEGNKNELLDLFDN